MSPIGELPQMTPIEIHNELKDLFINKDMVLKLLLDLGYQQCTFTIIQVSREKWSENNQSLLYKHYFEAFFNNSCLEHLNQLYIEEL
jgi:hypothetical protein